MTWFLERKCLPIQDTSYGIKKIILSLQQDINGKST
ncbi:hypothetical protein DK880_00489 [Candidatus Cardinium hertigii]|uniref:Uncharacterized protein n=1 Tax=Candidatus Cardinium hertigii TaxID=247481 RepID=A0A2Z3LCB5_9BACT|nr:hypothetical protein DK880_00489 [Candidatus Cardinium hertigii]